MKLNDKKIQLLIFDIKFSRFMVLIWLAIPKLYHWEISRFSRGELTETVSHLKSPLLLN